MNVVQSASCDVDNSKFNMSFADLQMLGQLQDRPVWLPRVIFAFPGAPQDLYLNF